MDSDLDMIFMDPMDLNSDLNPDMKNRSGSESTRIRSRSDPLTSYSYFYKTTNILKQLYIVLQM
ncbi:hypothetical protein RND71_005841 [Anisodus tanguticus]|uniref:Uncharacterized protein n=1 Tax=Anisodus tanguticus TaxID=243964 RepID=A0AAE1SQV3_9SOLA|nr:hypothetical protein RND71_005841 [Anisodus tanguticus]